MSSQRDELSLPITVGIKVEPQDTEERHRSHSALGIIRKSTVATQNTASKGSAVKTAMSDTLRGSVIAYHTQTGELLQGDRATDLESQIRWNNTFDGVSMNAANTIKEACEVHPDLKTDLANTKATADPKAYRKPWETEESMTDLYDRSTKGADPIAIAWTKKAPVGPEGI